MQTYFRRWGRSPQAPRATARQAEADVPNLLAELETGRWVAWHAAAGLGIRWRRRAPRRGAPEFAPWCVCGGTQSHRHLLFPGRSVLSVCAACDQRSTQSRAAATVSAKTIRSLIDSRSQSDPKLTCPLVGRAKPRLPANFYRSATRVPHDAVGARWPTFTLRPDRTKQTRLTTAGLPKCIPHL